MLFMVTYTFSTLDRDTIQNRFKATGGPPADGVKMLGRWHMAAGGSGFVLAETSDGVALAKWMQDWTDLIDFEIHPVNDDEHLMQVIGA